MRPRGVKSVLLVAYLAGSLLSVVAPVSAAQGGQVCNRVGATSTDRIRGKTVKLICVKVAKKQLWVRGTVAATTTTVAATTTTVAATTTTVAATTTTTVATGVQTSFGDGTFRVNVNIAPGRYATSRSGCYWERLSGFSGNLSDIIANDNVPGSRGIVDIKASDNGFKSSRCGTWNLLQTSARSTFGDGYWKVNGDIQPGMWQSTSATSCYWARLSGFGGELADILANDNASGATVIVQINAGDDGFQSSRCGTWSKIG